MRLIIAILSLLMVSCYNKPSVPEPLPEGPVANADIEQLKTMCSKQTTTFTPATPLAIHGTVISCDKEGYINGAIYIDDGSATAKLLVGIYDSNSIYPEGAQISITMPGLSAKIDNHQLVIGLKSENSEELYPIKSIVILDKHIICKNSLNKIEPQQYKIPELSTDICGKLITINDLSYVYTCYEEGYQGKYLRFCSSDEDFVYIYIDNYAAGFTTIPPVQPTNISGILTHTAVPFDDNHCFVILPRRSSDIW